MSLCPMMLGRRVQLTPTVFMTTQVLPPFTVVPTKENDTGLPLSRERRGERTVVPEEGPAFPPSTVVPDERPAFPLSTVVPDERAPASEDPEPSVVSDYLDKRARTSLGQRMGLPVRSAVRIRPVRRGDYESWAALRRARWPGIAAGDLHLEIERWWWTGDRDAQCLVAEEGRRLVGFIELSIRAFAKGCTTDRVACVEGWYVAPDARRRGIGRALMQAAEWWAREKGCRELGSESEILNTAGQRAHAAFGFTEVAKVVCFRKAMG